MDSFLIQHNSRKKEKNCSERPLKLIEFVLQNFDSTYHIYEKWSYLYNFSNLKFILQQNEYKLFNVSFSFQLNYFFLPSFLVETYFLFPCPLGKWSFFSFLSSFLIQEVEKKCFGRKWKVKVEQCFSSSFIHWTFCKVWNVWFSSLLFRMKFKQTGARLLNRKLNFCLLCHVQ